MKNSFFLFLLLCGSRVLAQNNQCNCTILSGDITSNTTLNTTNCYLLQGCVTVKSGVTLSIQPGVFVYGDHASLAELRVEKGGYLIANGTASSPVIFTSSVASGSKAPGDWRGITIAGKAVNNDASGNLTLSRACGNLAAGGADDNDSSGALRYVRIEYAGGMTSGDAEVNALTLACVGRKTVVRDISVANSATDNFRFLGGTVNVKELVSQDAKQNDFEASYGYRGKAQYLLSVRLDPNAHLSTGSSAFVAANDPAGSANTPVTHPVVSNMTIIGPAYCGATPASDFKNAVWLTKNAAGGIYNTAVSGWDYGFVIQDLGTVQNANDNGTLHFGYNSFYNNNNLFTSVSTPSWTTTGCAANMTNWVNLAGSLISCRQQGNQSLSTGFGYDASVCGDYCSAAPNFTLGESDMADADFSADELSDVFFDQVSYRGAFSTTSDWTAGWNNFCPQNDNYCAQQLLQAPGTNQGSLQLVPNPASDMVSLQFDCNALGKANVLITNNVDGQPVRVINMMIDQAGAQHISLSVADLKTGIYPVHITLPDGSVLVQKLTIL